LNFYNSPEPSSPTGENRLPYLQTHITCGDPSAFFLLLHQPLASVRKEVGPKRSH
jgi:hypothetical protein